MDKKKEDSSKVNEDQLEKRLDAFLSSIDAIYPSTRKLIWRSFLHGIFFGLGTTIGLSILVGIITFAIHQARVIPLLDGLIKQTQIEEVFTQ